MQQNEVMCKMLGHQQQNEWMICTIDKCDEISRYLCTQCMAENLHQHGQENLNHIMNLENLCHSILNMINRHKHHQNLVNDWIKQFKKINIVLGSHDNINQYKNVFDDVQYDQECILKKNTILNLFNDIHQSMSDIYYQQICVNCFNEQKHNHQSLKEQIKRNEQYTNENDAFQDFELFREIMEKWVFQQPYYNNHFIFKIEYILSGKNKIIDNKQLNKLIFIQNSTYTINNIQQDLSYKLSIRLKNMKKSNQQLKEELKIRYADEQCFDKKYFFELNNDLPQILVSPNDQDYVLQDENNTLVVGDLFNQKIKKIKLLDITIRIMKFSEDFNYLFCSDREGYLLCYATKNYKEIFHLKLHDIEILAFLPLLNNEIISYSLDGELKILNLISKKVLVKFQIKIQSPIQQFNYYREYSYLMNDRPNCIEYDQKKQIIFVACRQLKMIYRKKLHLRNDDDDRAYDLHQLQLIQNSTLLLSCDYVGLSLWKYDGGILSCINRYDITSFKFCANDHNNRIIIMGKCFFEILDYNFKRLKLGNFDCHPTPYSILGRKFQIEQNKCYIILISNDSIEIQKRVLQDQQD